MAKLELTKDEIQVISVLRAIKKVPAYVDETDVGDITEALLVFGEVESKEQDAAVSGPALQLFIEGFVRGYGAYRAEAAGFHPDNYPVYDGDGDQTISGGPTGGVVAGQGNDPKYVTQTGPRADQEVE